MFDTILKHYITATFYLNLYKTAKLAPEEFKQVLNNPYMMYKLEEDGLIDEFVKTMPNMSESELNDMIMIHEDGIKQRGKLSPNKQQIVDKFLERFGKYTLDNILDVFIEKNKNDLLNKEVSFDYKDIDLIKDYRNHRIEDFVYEFLDSTSGDSVALLSFIKTYYDIINQKDPILKMHFYEQLAKKLIYMSKFINTRKELDEDNKYSEAKSLRESDMFDYILSYQNQAKDLQNNSKNNYQTEVNKRQTLPPPAPPPKPSFLPLNTQTQQFTSKTPTLEDITKTV